MPHPTNAHHPLNYIAEKAADRRLCGILLTIMGAVWIALPTMRPPASVVVSASGLSGPLEAVSAFILPVVAGTAMVAAGVVIWFRYR